MANVWGTIKDAGQFISMTGLALLEAKRSVSQYFNSDYSKDFQPKQGSMPVGDAIKVQYPMQYAIRNTLEYQGTAAAKRYASVTIGEPFGVDLPEVDSIEDALSTPAKRDKFTEMYIDPAMSRLGAEIDQRCALYAYIHAAGVVGVLGTDPTSLDSTSAAARQRMVELGAPEGDRGMLMPPRVVRGIKSAYAAHFNPVTDITKMFRQGIISYTDGFDWHECMALYRHTAGTWAGAVTVTTAPTDGATTVVLTCTTADTFKAGDKFCFADVYPVQPENKRRFGSDLKTFTVTAAATGASSAATISFSPAIYGPGSPFQNVDALPIATAALTLWPGTTSPNGKAGNLGLALPKNAFALVSVELEHFPDWEICKSQRDPDSGVVIRFGAGSDIRSSKKIRRFDTCIGFGELYNDLAMVVACGG